MTEFIVSAIQQQVKIYDTPLDYQQDIFRFLDTAKEQGAQLAVLPALSPLMLIPPLSSGLKLNLLKRSGGKKSGLADKLLNRVASKASQAMGGIQAELQQILEHHPGEIYDAYIDLFSAAALKYRMTIVAGSFFLREEADEPCGHLAYVFGPDGMLLGSQQKLHISPDEAQFCQPGSSLDVIDTPVGRLGILIGDDALYPECGRVLAYRGAQILVNLSASDGPTAFAQLRHAFAARVNENQLFGVQSVLFGRNLLNPADADFVGRAAILQPFSLSIDTPDGVLSQAGDDQRESAVRAALNLDSLKDYWLRSSPQLRRAMKADAFAPLAAMYTEGRTLDKAYWNPPGSLFEIAVPTASDEVVQSPPSPPESGAGLLLSPFADDDD